MRDGRALRLFLPRLRYAGFADTIPDGWEDVECFLFEQRGYLRAWGRGAAARARQREWIAAANARRGIVEAR